MSLKGIIYISKSLLVGKLISSSLITSITLSKPNAKPTDGTLGPPNDSSKLSYLPPPPIEPISLISVLNSNTKFV